MILILYPTDRKNVFAVSRTGKWKIKRSQRLSDGRNIYTCWQENMNREMPDMTIATPWLLEFLDWFKKQTKAAELKVMQEFGGTLYDVLDERGTEETDATVYPMHRNGRGADGISAKAA